MNMDLGEELELQLEIELEPMNLKYAAREIATAAFKDIASAPF